MIPFKSKKFWIRLIIVTVSLSLLLTGIIGFMHTPKGRPLWGVIGVECPFDKIPPERLEAARLEAAKLDRGTDSAPERLAMGFSFEHTTLSDIQAWADTHGISCKTKRKNTFTKCTDVPAKALQAEGNDPFETAQFQFSPHTGLLVNMTATHTQMSAEDASVKIKSIETFLRSKLGEPAKVLGQSDPAYLGKQFMRMYHVEYNFKDYKVNITTTNFQERGMMLRQHYMAISD